MHKRMRPNLIPVPPFAATMTILLYLPDVSLAQPFAVVFGSALGAAIGTALSLFLGFGPGIATVAALIALIVLPLLRAYHPPGVALAMYPPLSHPGVWFAVQVALPVHTGRGDLRRPHDPAAAQLATISCTAPNRDWRTRA
jgi:CBS-domain-containing membrane protein